MAVPASEEDWWHCHPAGDVLGESFTKLQNQMGCRGQVFPDAAFASGCFSFLPPWGSGMCFLYVANSAGE